VTKGYGVEVDAVVLRSPERPMAMAAGHGIRTLITPGETA
jgi:hypothetical protein